MNCMRKTSRTIASAMIVITTTLLLAVAAKAAPILMSADWGKKACDAWNTDSSLTDGLAESGWITNDSDRGYKVIHVYRTDCGGVATTELRISSKGGKASCTYGGAVESTNLKLGSDYIMHADTARWKEMGAGEYGPLKAMALFRLKFSGPKWEAMKNMGPFANFLLLAGKVESDTASCPK